jgi:hypothetical protein
MVMISLDGYAVVMGLFLLGVVNGLASAIGNFLARKYCEHHISGKKDDVNGNK